jgi:hypothetical protein
MRVARTSTRQIDPNGPILLWDQERGRDRRGLVVVTRSCANRECTCSSVGIIGYSVDGALSGVESEGDRTKFSYASEDHAPATLCLQAWVDVHTGAVTFGKGEAEPQDPKALALLQRELDAPILEELARRHWAAKHWEIKPVRWRSVDWSGWQVGDLVPWGEVFGEVRQDVYVHEGRTFLAIEMYCIVPSCDCDDVLVEFAEFAGQEAHVVGTVHARPPSGRACEVDVEGVPEALILALWSQFLRRHRGAEALRARRARIRAEGRHIVEHAARSAAVAPTVAASANTTPRAGRNDPCPCGSGKKYKRCHGA